MFNLFTVCFKIFFCTGYVNRVKIDQQWRFHPPSKFRDRNGTYSHYGTVRWTPLNKYLNHYRVGLSHWLLENNAKKPRSDSDLELCSLELLHFSLTWGAVKEQPSAILFFFRTTLNKAGFFPATTLVSSPLRTGSSRGRVVKAMD